MQHATREQYWLDTVDLAIIKALTDNARITMTQLGNTTDRSRVACFARIKAMEEAGIIESYTTIINWDLIAGVKK